MRQTTRDAMREQGIPARSLFPPLPSQAEIWWQGNTPAPTGRVSREIPLRSRRLTLPALPLSELLLPVGMMALSLFR